MFQFNHAAGSPAADWRLLAKYYDSQNMLAKSGEQAPEPSLPQTTTPSAEEVTDEW